MNIYQKRHAILAKRIGNRLTPTQLKAKVFRGSNHGN